MAVAAPAAADASTSAGAKPTDESVPAPGQATDHDGRLRIAPNEVVGGSLLSVAYLDRLQVL